MTLEERAFLRHILFRKDRKEKKFKLSIGAPSSPLISNFVMAIFDEEVSIYCGSLGVAFTRYADDLAFSTNKKGILFDIPNQVKTILGETTQNKITVNDSKTVFSSTKHNRHITGVTISNDRKLSIGRQKKRMISAMVHKFSFGVLEEDKIANLQGQLAFVKNIEPEFLDRLTTKYGIDVILKIFPSSGKNT
jgi:retron-type reverse transcriptase